RKEATEILLGDGTKSFSEISKALKDHAKFNVDLGNAFAKQGKQSADAAHMATISVLVAVLVVAVVVSVLVTRSIVGPINT
ncbi:hypothetical protein, partial [Acinetobacter baumannii]|uniref:hypothetical protein n=1 Tax=Acinetobacter baumannii TaxID=470 RepID=UPI001487FCA4